MQLFSILISKQFNAVCVYDEWDQELEPLILMLGIRIINVVYLQNERDNENENSGLHMYWHSLNHFDWRCFIMLKPNEMLLKWLGIFICGAFTCPLTFQKVSMFWLVSNFK